MATDAAAGAAPGGSRDATSIRTGESTGAGAGAGGGEGAGASSPQVFTAEWDADGVWVYQAFNDAIADYAAEHQRLGGPGFNPTRMTWIKPSFAWVLYRSAYASKHNQRRVLKLLLPHDALAALLAACQCKHGGGGSNGRVQWDPARDMFAADGRVPRRMLRERAIQIGLKGPLSKQYVDSVTRIVDVTPLAHRVGAVHRLKPKAATTAAAWADLKPLLPVERPYTPTCGQEVLKRLGMAPGPAAEEVALLGKGKWRRGK